MTEQPPVEPPSPVGRKSHRDRIADIVRLLPTGKTGAVCIDNTPEHRAYYRHRLSNCRQVKIVYEGKLSPDIYLIKVEKVCDTLN